MQMTIIIYVIGIDSIMGVVDTLLLTYSTRLIHV